MSVKMKFGSKDIPFVYKGDKLVYPNPIKDGLLLWYDFKGMRNTDTTKDVAKDLSGNGNDGTLTNFNFTEESGYKDNTLVFDGVDDSLTIPELVLDETAMSVMHDGKIYVYEDDKVLTVGEDGEIIGSGKNIVAGSNFQDGVGLWSAIYGTHKVEEGIYKKTFTDSVGAARIEILFYGLEKGIYTLALKSKFPTEVYLSGFVNATLLSDIRLQPSTSDFKLDKIVFEVIETGLNTTIRLYVREQGFNNTYEIDWYSLVKGETLLGHYTPAPEDYTKPTISPTSITDLQLYNKTLRKNELLHNAESKGLKKLKPGVAVQDGLVLHYDFSHESNNSEYKDKAFDYSGNGNHGVLNNFNFTEESGYDGGKLLFDGVDDSITSKNKISARSMEVTLKVNERLTTYSTIMSTFTGNGYGGFLVYNYNPYIRIVTTGGQFTTRGLNVGDFVTLSIVFTNEECILYANGELVERFPFEGYEPEQSNPNADMQGFLIGRYYSGNLYMSKDEFYSVRAYEKALTAEEVAHNYQIEKEKFNIE